MKYSTEEPNNRTFTALANEEGAVRLAGVNRTLKTLHAVHRTILHASDEQDLLHRIAWTLWKPETAASLVSATLNATRPKKLAEGDDLLTANSIEDAWFPANL
jgi:hypothetical protein